MGVSDREREYMRRVGELKQGSHDDALARHRALPIAERVRKSWALYLATRASARLEARSDDPSPFYARARALGLYRP
jgi:hypothetical protein